MLFRLAWRLEGLEASRVFYEKLGFEVVGGDASQNWQILRNGDHTIGIFQGMFEENILTFIQVGMAKRNHLIRLPTCASCNGSSRQQVCIWLARPMRAARGRPALCFRTQTAI